MKPIYFLIFPTLFFVGCGGESNGGKSSTPSSSSLVSSNTSSLLSSSSSSLPVVEKLDCTKLNPSKVYILGNLDDSSSTHAIADPANPMDFCIGLPHTYVHTAIISNEGKLVYTTSNGPHFYQMTPDVLTKVSNEETSDPNDLIWQYPLSSINNDTIKFTSPLALDCGLQTFKLMPQSNDLYYSCPNQIIHTESIAYYYDIGNSSENVLLSVLTDGSLLVFTFEEKLKIVDPSRNETVLNMPSSIPEPVCASARTFVDDQTKENKIWVECYDRYYYSSKDENLHRRYTIDIATKHIQDDGVFSPIPNGARGYLDGKFDGEGNLWVVGDMGPSDPFINIVAKRPMKGKAAEIVYAESSLTSTGDWRKEESPSLRLKNSSSLLITGH